MNESKIILIAGGTGLIGNSLTNYLRNKGHQVHILTRGKTQAEKHLFHWDPMAKVIDEKGLDGVQVLVNLVGAGIADKKWTDSRKKELIASRVLPTQFLAEIAPKLASLKQYVSASGINCYGYDNDEKIYVETDPFGTDFLSQVVKTWEESADLFQPYCPVTKIRISVVLAKEGGALPKIATPVKWLVGSPLGSGKQWMPWISLHDLTRVFEHVINKNLDGAFNAVTQNTSNKEVTKAIATALKKPLFLPNVPAFALKAILGEMASVVLDGLQASNQKLIQTGFSFKETDLKTILPKYLK